MKTIEASQEDEYFYEGLGRLDDEEEERIEHLYKEAEKAIETQAERSKIDISIQEAL